MHGKLFDGAKDVRDWLDRLGARDGVKRGMRLDGAANGHESHAAPSAIPRRQTALES